MMSINRPVNKPVNRTRILIVMTIGIILVIVGVYIVTARPFALVPTNGGGDIPDPLPDPDPDPTVVPPSTPTLQQPLSPDDDGDIILIWSIISEAGGYQVEMSTNGAVYQLIKTTGEIAIVHHDLTNGVYSFKVRAYNSAGYSSYSNIRSVVVSIPVPPPPPPSLPDAPILDSIDPYPNTDGKITLQWNIVSSDGGDIIYDIFMNSQLVESVFETSCEVTVLTSGTYSFFVKAKNSYGSSDSSNVQSIIVQLINIPDAPQLDQLTYDFVDEGVEVQLSWSEVDCESYNVYRSINGGTYVLIEENLISMSYSEVLIEGGLYAYKITAINEDGESNLSNPTSIRLTGDGGASIPTDLTLVYVVIVLVVVIGAITTTVLLVKKKKR